MKIQGQGPLNLTPLVNTYIRQVKKSEHGKQETLDRADISSAARFLRELLQQSAELPDVREAKVKELRERISLGTYNVSLDDLADSILRELKL
ncbi:MAG: flagellar biosynthesis anti-sigma factor FlgM [Thermanaeromonas sp.]|uniref:flagellar biosynthesis anti-sigma factor FlgM n=1 Tax=Thermanaeromonas sp. TaxID=2003697 RepID=UPI00243CE728|nr:flagellar biosynthesis anti-sigma factor FlgM [Thermanaeromonas sp.]MCG0277930.1 flagellar biosynthesis anti-sigma factor FlgM [Thermanaeromonas sp.]